MNFDHHISCGLITEETRLPPVDVIIGGPPCQSFSSAGLRKEEDPRSMLVGVFAKLVAIHKPRAFVFENVEGFAF
jgi:DNA (cytosine-5)-methyltransferase 1